MTNLAEQYDGHGFVRVDAEAVTADVKFTDAEVAEILRQVPEARRSEFFVRGARAGLLMMGNDLTTRLRDSMRFMQATLDTQVASFGERMSEKVREQLGDADTGGHVERRLRELLARGSADLKASIEKALPDAFDGQTKRSVERIQVEGDRVMKELTGLFSENGLAWREIRAARRDFAERLEEVKLAMTVAQTKAANPSPQAAGLDYETWVHDQLVTIGTLRGDDVEATAGKAGKIPRCLKGDTRIMVAADGIDVTAPPCIAVEIRDRQESEFSLSDIATMVENREAQVAVVVAAHAGSFPKQYAGRPFAVSRQKRLICLVLDTDSADVEVVLAAAYQLACILALESVRKSREGNWDEVARKVEAIEQAAEAMAEARTTLSQIERKAHEGGAAADKNHTYLMRLVAELTAIVRV